jgi:hypothetical protein
LLHHCSNLPEDAEVLNFNYTHNLAQITQYFESVWQILENNCISIFPHCFPVFFFLLFDSSVCLRVSLQGLPIKCQVFTQVFYAVNGTIINALMMPECALPNPINAGTMAGEWLESRRVVFVLRDLI